MVFCASRDAGRARITEMRRFPSHNHSSLSTHARFPGKPIGIGKKNCTHAFLPWFKRRQMAFDPPGENFPEFEPPLGPEIPVRGGPPPA